ncbi:MAG: disulfide bond formation protein DsbA [Anaerolineaceae bacterium]|nr:disulfide bond formation protein DsbA [Anaerolineaceae bacterium]
MSQVKQRQGSRRRSKSTKAGLSREARLLLLIGIPIILVAIVLIALYRGTQPVSQVTDESRLIRPDSPSLGAADAPVTIVEFLDPECESCRAAFPAVKQILEEYSGRVQLVVRYFPLHTNSVLAATATEAAGQQGKYWEMQELLFTRQTEWGEQRTPQTDRFINYAQELGLDIDQFTAALDDSAVFEKIERDRQDGIALGVDGTPTFFINGRLVEPLSYDTIISMIEDGLAQ